MTLLKIFNQQLANLQNVFKEIEEAIMQEGWTDTKKEQAIKIVRQITKENILLTGCRGYDFCVLEDLSIQLSPKECGIENATKFKKENLIEADRYVENLIKDINEISNPNIYFSAGGHSYKEEETTCTFYVGWEF